MVILKIISCVQEVLQKIKRTECNKKKVNYAIVILLQKETFNKTVKSYKVEPIFLVLPELSNNVINQNLFSKLTKEWVKKKDKKLPF